MFDLARFIAMGADAEVRREAEQFIFDLYREELRAALKVGQSQKNYFGVSIRDGKEGRIFEVLDFWLRLFGRFDSHQKPCLSKILC